MEFNASYLTAWSSRVSLSNQNASIVNKREGFNARGALHDIALLNNIYLTMKSNLPNLCNFAEKVEKTNKKLVHKNSKLICFTPSGKIVTL